MELGKTKKKKKGFSRGSIQTNILLHFRHSGFWLMNPKIRNYILNV